MPRTGSTPAKSCPRADLQVRLRRPAPLEHRREKPPLSAAAEATAREAGGSSRPRPIPKPDRQLAAPALGAARAGPGLVRLQSCAVASFRACSRVGAPSGHGRRPSSVGKRGTQSTAATVALLSVPAGPWLEHRTAASYGSLRPDPGTRREAAASSSAR